LGNGGLEEQLLPQKIKYLSDKEILEIGCGSDFVIVTTNG